MPFGYYDDFATDLGWTEFGSNASAGIWERVVPNGTDFNGFAMNPYVDVEGDCGEVALITGNGAPGGGAGSDDVDDGETNISSPLMDLTTYSDPHIYFHTWFMTGGGNGTSSNDSLIVYITNLTDTVVLDSFGLSDAMLVWRSNVYKASDYINITNSCKLLFNIKDDNPGHLVEGGVDNFYVTDGFVSVKENENVDLAVYPNPFSNELNLNYSFNGSEVITVYNILGKIVYQEKNTDVTSGKILNLELIPALYTLVISSENKVVSKKIISK